MPLSPANNSVNTDVQKRRFAFEYRRVGVTLEEGQDLTGSYSPGANGNIDKLVDCS